jgi:hypothetical protein
MVDRRHPGRPMPIKRTLSLAFLVASLARCGNPTGVRLDDVRLHRSIWLSQHVTSYTYVYEQTGFFMCCINGEPIAVVVRDDTVRSAIVVATGQSLPSPGPSFTIDALFDQAEGAARNGMLHDVAYDPLLGYPTRIVIAGPPDAAGSLFGSGLEPVP